MAVSLSEGKYLVALARKSIRSYLDTHKIADFADAPPGLKQKAGAFVTLESYPGNDLRGCIGLIVAAKPLAQAVA
ncbi:Uncharacterised protein [Candidatus Burarchaeum australiense]|nr:Uncharacterised protein [Candidatus Burarchaeum australiense]